MPRKAPPAALLTELEQTRTAYARAELRARTFLVEQGLLDQTHTDVSAALARLCADVSSEGKSRNLRESRSATTAGSNADG
jgi:hypothetical protein